MRTGRVLPQQKYSDIALLSARCLERLERLSSIYIYIYRERERERERCIFTYMKIFNLLLILMSQ